MNIYLLTQESETGYDTYDSAVVIARSKAAAKKIHPRGGLAEWKNRYSCWATSPDQVTATLIGTAAVDRTNGEVVCASFNAG